MDLTTRYLGLTLANPFVPGASPLADDLDVVLRLEDAGASAIVLRSLFEEQLGYEHLTEIENERHAHPSAEAHSYFPVPSEYALGPDRYFSHIAKLKRRVGVPVIASLNGITAEGWLEHARLIEQAGADALELNFYYVASDPREDALSVERRVVDIVAVLKESVRIPIAIKLSPFYSAIANIAGELHRLGADGLVLFNRFYQPDIDPEMLETTPTIHLSNSSELLLRLRWIAILHGRVAASLAASGGIHQAIDAVKAIMAGADVVQMVSALLRYGPAHLARVKQEFEQWGDDHGYISLGEMRGSMSLARCPDPRAFERGNYIRALQLWRAGTAPEIKSI